jgi:16S rRNA (cytosine1402-N4)-methyltransferase
MLTPRPGCRFLDATFGGGGHTTAILETCDCYVCGIDRDPEAAERAALVSSRFQGRFDFINGKFSELAEILHERGKFDGVIFDFGTSSFQMDNPERGFSFSRPGPLDMRMDKRGMSARNVVNEFAERDIAKILRTYGDEPRSKRIAAEIVKTRKKMTIDTTAQLRNIVLSVCPITSIMKKYSRIDAATKTFQALRIFVNDELAEINAGLLRVHKILNVGGRIVTIAFHSLEDRIVKNWSRDNKKYITPMHLDDSVGGGRLYTRPRNEEIIGNPRARSAILRGFIYTGYCNEGTAEC